MKTEGGKLPRVSGAKAPGANCKLETLGFPPRNIADPANLFFPDGYIPDRRQSTPQPYFEFSEGADCRGFFATLFVTLFVTLQMGARFMQYQRP